MSDAVPHQHPRSTGAGTGRILLWISLLSLMFWPRLFLLGFWIFSDMVGDAISSAFVCVAGFLLAPWTILTYASMWSIDSNEVAGWEWIAVGMAVLVDVLTWSVGRRSLH